MKTELVLEGKYDEYRGRRPVRLPTSSLPLQRIETIDQPPSSMWIRPTVSLPSEVNMMEVALLRITSDPESLIASVARVSHRSEGKGPDLDRDLIRSLIKRGHESVLEHAVATFKITGISRACANQLTRHRLASFVQESQRYVDVRDRNLVRPQSFTGNDWQEAEDLYSKAIALYKELISRGVPKEDARYVLPIGAETGLVVTANFREWRHILKLRLHRAAQWEIRELARLILEILQKHAPTVFEDLGGAA